MLSPSDLRDVLLDLRIDATAAVSPPPPGLELDVWRDRDGDVVAEGYTTEHHHWLRLPGFATYRFGRMPGPITAIPVPGTAREAVADCHRRFVLPLALQAFRLEVLHASGIVVPDGVVALCGLPRTGKSTLAFGLHRRGYPLWADDSVALDVGDRVAAIPVPFQIRLRPASRAYFEAETGPTSTLPAATAPLATQAAAPLAAIFVLSRIRDGAGPRAHRLRAAAAPPALLHHAQCFTLRDRARKQRMVEQYLAIAGRVPVYALRFQPSFHKLPAVLDAVERALEGA
jgi:hypothetical protein